MFRFEQQDSPPQPKLLEDWDCKPGDTFISDTDGETIALVLSCNSVILIAGPGLLFNSIPIENLVNKYVPVDISLKII